MKTLLFALLASSLVCACSTAQRKAEQNVTFSCVNGEKVFVRFNNNSAVLTRYGTAIELQQERSASGFVYTNGPNTIRGQGDDLTIEVGRMFPIQCKAVNNHLSSR